MKHNVKAGDAFMFGGLRWEVEPKYKSDAAMFRSINEEGEYMRYLLWAVEDADSLDWIKPEVTFTKKQTEELKSHYIKWHRIAFDYDTGRVVPEKSWFIDWLDEHTEKE